MLLLLVYTVAQGLANLQDCRTCSFTFYILVITDTGLHIVMLSILKTLKFLLVTDIQLTNLITNQQLTILTQVSQLHRLGTSCLACGKNRHSIKLMWNSLNLARMM